MLTHACVSARPQMPGYCHWPAIVFSLRHCRKREVGPLVDSHQPGRTLLHFYGEHNHVWVPPASLDTRAEEHDAHLAALQAWTRRTRWARGIARGTYDMQRVVVWRVVHGGAGSIVKVRHKGVLASKDYHGIEQG